jgi:O-antigen/teichoic acid export membrane protein
MKYGGEFSRVDAITAKEIFKMYLINFAGFLTLNTDLYIAKNNFDEITFVELGVLSRVALGIVSVTAVIVAIQTPSYSSLHAMGNYERLLYNVGFTSKIISALVIFFGVAFIFTYEPLVKFITLNQPALGTHIVATWMVFAVLVVNIMNIGAAIISTGDSDLVRIALPASVIGFVGAIVGASSLGPVGMIIGMIIGGTLSLVSHLKLLKNILRN